MGRFKKFLGKANITVDGEVLEISMNVKDVQRLLDLSKNKENEIVEGVSLISDIVEKSVPEEDRVREEIEAFVLKNYAELSEQIILALGWTTKEKLEEEKKKLQESQSIQSADSKKE